MALAVRTVLSADARHVAVIPQAPLAYLTGYTFESTGLLRDVYGAPVAVPVVEFTTQSQAQAQALDLDALVFSFPVDGMVTMRAPAGALPAGTQILVLNASVGSALTYAVGDSGSGGRAARVDRRPPVGHRDGPARQGYHDRADRVRGPRRHDRGRRGGRHGARARGLRDAPARRAPPMARSPSSSNRSPRARCPRASAPTCRARTSATASTIESADKPRFKQEVDLAFPRPAGAPEGAFFYVYRKIELPGGRVSFETIDQAFDEGGKVVTASSAVRRLPDELRRASGIGGAGAAQLDGHEPATTRS